MQDSYRELFLSESQEYLSNISSCLVKLEEKPSDPSSINEIFRCVHTLKGMSATMGYEKLTTLSHEMEDLLDELRNKKQELSPEIMDTLFAAVDILEQLFTEIKGKKESVLDISEIGNTLKSFLAENQRNKPRGKGKGAVVAPVKDFTEFELKKLKDSKSKKLNVFNVRINLSKDCALKEARAFLVITNLKRFGEIISTQPSIEDLKAGNFEYSFTAMFSSKEDSGIVRQELMNISEVDEVSISSQDLSGTGPSDGKQGQPSAANHPANAPAAGPVYVKKIQSMRIPVERLDKIMNLMGELSIAKIRLVQIVQTYKLEPLEEVGFSLDRLISALQDEVMQTRLLPVAYILDAFPRVVRDVAKKQGKDVELEILGGEIELDRMVLDEMSDPLLHLVRNAVDHGLETSEERKKNNKDPRGKLTIQVSRQRGQIYIEVIDDGQGIDFEAVCKIAISKGLVTPEETAEMDEKKVLDLITMPGFSTAKAITDISGRGVGLDVVKSKIEALGGRVDFETKKGEGSRFILTLPLTLAIIKAMLVKVEEEIFAIPLMNIRETIKIRTDELRYLQNFEVVKVREEVIPVIRLNKELGISSAKVASEESDDRVSLVIVEYGKKALGLVVSQVLGEQDIAVKPLGSLVKRTKGIAGATILGDGRVALILDIMSLR
ncbi:MAG: chemotaxis protein CheA [Candidatus Omnitrophica bacterium]|jgi:two-component system chemotaxis sensor kinase CheA|nr:chemotaxis protein CheA [Candidatus Omnitrophota bacterium]MDD5079279.1 chemotaxis protein CheA [Candidatus Omnitrophota bacterium]